MTKESKSSWIYFIKWTRNYRITKRWFKQLLWFFHCLFLKIDYKLS